MSGNQDFSIAPVGAVGDTAAVQRIGADRSVPSVGPQSDRADTHGAAVKTGGNLKPAVAQFVVNADTHDLVIQVKDPDSGEVISEYPSKEVEAMAKFMRQYAETAARLRSATHNNPSST